MQKTNNQARNAHRQMQSSTTLSRKYVRRPQKSTSVMVNHVVKPANASYNGGQINCAKVGNTQNINNKTLSRQVVVNQKSNIKSTNNIDKQELKPQLTAKELKDQAIKKALENAATSSDDSKKVKNKKKKSSKIHFGFGKVMLAISCASAAVMAIVYFANANMPDVSLQVAALQTGIDASYPGYVPRDFSTSSVTSEDGKVTMEFKNFDTGDSFELIEETSSWDSSALEANYVKEEFGENYTVVREQGLTIYVSGSDAAWVSGGVVFKINTTSGSLTNKQIKSIAVSL